MSNPVALYSIHPRYLYSVPSIQRGWVARIESSFGRLPFLNSIELGLILDKRRFERPNAVDQNGNVWDPPGLPEGGTEILIPISLQGQLVSWRYAWNEGPTVDVSAGAGIVVPLGSASYCERMGFGPCNEVDGYFQISNIGFQPPDPFAQLSLYWNSQWFWASTQIKAGFVFSGHPLRVSRISATVNHLDGTFVDPNASSNRSAIRAVAFIRFRRKAERMPPAPRA